VSAASRVRVRLPAPLRVLASVPSEVTVVVPGPVTQRAVLDAIEEAHPCLRGTIRDQASGRRRAFIRFFVHESDLSDLGPDEPLPRNVADGVEPFVVIGAMAGG